MDPLFDSTALLGMKALLVEDDSDSREVMGELLAMHGLEVRTAESAEEGLAILASFAPNVLLSDIHMPGQDGLWLIRHVRALPPDQGGLTPAIAVSAGSTPEETLGAGFHVHVAKPFDPAYLVSVVRGLAKEGAK